METQKIFDFDDLTARVSGFKAENRKIVLCHGCFDLMHPGHIKHLQAAKKMGDVLVVTVTPDRFVNKGSGRPAFPETLRAESVAALECVDLVAINKWPDPVETIRALRPDIYVKGQEYETDENKRKELEKDLKAVKEVKGVMAFTHEQVYSSTRLLSAYSRKPWNSGTK